MAPAPSQIAAQGLDGFWDDTFLIGVAQGSGRSDLMRALSRGALTLSDGRGVAFRDWYRARHPEVSVSMMTQISPEFGITWGISSGERGEKYSMSAGFSIGFIYQIKTGRRGLVTLSASTLLGGALRERACVADYGAVGGIQAVNCRLAATALPPEETLRYLIRETGRRESRAAVTYEYRF